MKIFIVAFAFNERPDRIFNTRGKAEEYIENQAEKRWQELKQRAKSTKDKFLENARSLYSIEEMEVL